eukprot:362548-Chlamydomonas_euryale.AAC.15
MSAVKNGARYDHGHTFSVRTDPADFGDGGFGSADFLTLRAPTSIANSYAERKRSTGSRMWDSTAVPSGSMSTTE